MEGRFHLGRGEGERESDIVEGRFYLGRLATYLVPVLDVAITENDYVIPGTWYYTTLKVDITEY